MALRQLLYHMVGHAACLRRDERQLAAARSPVLCIPLPLTFKPRLTSVISRGGRDDPDDFGYSTAGA